MGGLLERRALINHFCSGDVSLMPELKRDQVVRGRRADQKREKRGGKLKLRLLAPPPPPLSLFSLSLCVLVLHLCRQEATVTTFFKVCMYG